MAARSCGVGAKRAGAIGGAIRRSAFAALGSSGPNRATRAATWGLRPRRPEL